MSGTPQSAWSLGLYFLGVIAIAVILPPMFNSSRGSILIAMLFHFQQNDPIWPDGQPWRSYLFAVAAVIVFLLNQKTLLNHESAVTEVLM